MRARLVAAGAALLVVLAGLAARTSWPGAVADPAGSILYTVLVAVLVLVVRPRTRPVAAAAVGLAVSVGVELLQLTGLPAEVAQRAPLARLVLGSTFGAPDLAWYLVGGAVAWPVCAATRALAWRA